MLLVRRQLPMWLGTVLVGLAFGTACTPYGEESRTDAVTKSRSKVAAAERTAHGASGTTESPDASGANRSEVASRNPDREKDARRAVPQTVSSSKPANRGGRNAAKNVGDANSPDPLSALSDAFREVARKVKPSVVQVSVEIRPRMGRIGSGSRLSGPEIERLTQRFGPLSEFDLELLQFFQGPPPEPGGPDYERYNVPLRVGSGSGWVYDDRGHVVTNHHVVANADGITLTFPDDTEAPAELLGSDPRTDIALLVTKKADLLPATLAAEPCQQGDIVLAVGSPFRYAFSVSQGIVSATGRRMGILGPYGYENFIQTDAAINPGNSGGPLANARGEVVGMNAGIASRSGTFAGIGFAIPVEMIRDVVGELIEKGEVERGYLGVMISDDKRLLASFGTERGVLIEDMLEGGPADQAGLKSGDIVKAIDGESVESTAALRRRISRTDPDETVRLTLLRDGEETDVEVTLKQQPMEGRKSERPSQEPPTGADSPEADTLSKLGLELEGLQTITPQIARRYRLDPSWGVLVVGVRRFSAASMAGLRSGNIITHVQGRKVTDVDELRSAVEAGDIEKGIRMRVRTPGGPSRYVLVSLD